MSVKRLMLVSLLVLTACTRNSLENELPKEWAVDMTGKSIGEITLMLGKPTEDMSAKGYFNWVQQQPPGRRVLKLLCSAECKSDEKPSSLLFLIYKDADGNRVHSRDLLLNK